MERDRKPKVAPAVENNTKAQDTIPVGIAMENDPVIKAIIAGARNKREERVNLEAYFRGYEI